MDILQKIKTVLARTLADKGTAYLFGSRARGVANADSDWDVLVILNKDTLEVKDYDEITYPLYALGWDENQIISPILYTKSEWLKQSFTPFFKNVEREKIVLL